MTALPDPLPVPATRPAPDGPAGFAALTAACLALLLLALLGHVADPRQLDGAGVWVKPVKFAASLALTFATLALVARRLSAPAQGSPATRAIVAAMTVAAGFEMAYIMAQASRAEASHFNAATVFHQIMYGLMGVGAVTLVLCIAAMARVVARDPGAALGPATRAGVIWGFALSCGLTLIVAGYMSGSGSHFTAPPAPGDPVWPVLGWSGSTGDLRPAHFAALHAMQALPLLGLALDRSGVTPRVMTGAALVYAVVTLALFAQALLGLPVIAL